MVAAERQESVTEAHSDPQHTQHGATNHHGPGRLDSKDRNQTNGPLPCSVSVERCQEISNNDAKKRVKIPAGGAFSPFTLHSTSPASASSL